MTLEPQHTCCARRYASSSGNKIRLPLQAEDLEDGSSTTWRFHVSCRCRPGGIARVVLGMASARLPGYCWARFEFRTCRHSTSKPVPSVFTFRPTCQLKDYVQIQASVQVAVDGDSRWAHLSVLSRAGMSAGMLAPVAPGQFTDARTTLPGRSWEEEGVNGVCPRVRLPSHVISNLSRKHNDPGLMKTPPDVEKPLRSFKREAFCNAVKTPNLEENLHMKQASR